MTHTTERTPTILAAAELASNLDAIGGNPEDIFVGMELMWFLLQTAPEWTVAVQQELIAGRSPEFLAVMARTVHELVGALPIAVQQ